MWVGIIIGLVIGAPLGILFVALCSASGRDSRARDEWHDVVASDEGHKRCDRETENYVKENDNR